MELQVTSDTGAGNGGMSFRTGFCWELEDFQIKVFSSFNKLRMSGDVKSARDELVEPLSTKVSPVSIPFSTV